MNLALLGVLVDLLGVPHQVRQLLALAAIVPMSFVLLRRVVFQHAEHVI
jgi:putative flippase GtrA